MISSLVKNFKIYRFNPHFNSKPSCIAQIDCEPYQLLFNAYPSVRV